ncbi:CAP domain-containing protein [Maribacter sp. 2308TA10-17]|uniref:CAP domain-containing protein n=1 Tax=Maribacter sp. 2308TA10-17 TaxID=3386276 RepID=UPI0039BC2311
MRSAKNLILLTCTILVFQSCSKEETNPLSKEEQQELEAVNLSARASAKKLYDDYYLASKSTSADVAWSGNVVSCEAGDVPQATMDKIFMRIAYFRKAVGLNNSISENETKSDKAQDAALLMKSNGALDHFPPDTWSCYSESGKEGAGNSLLTQVKNAEAIDSYIRDQGSKNGPVGHRRWLLWPKLQEIGIGNTDATNAIWVLGNAGTPPADAPEFISWPPEGYAPKQLAYQRWSFSIAGADFNSTTIVMKDGNNQAIALEIEELNNQFGDRTIVWIPSINTSALLEDTSYTITINDVDINNQMETFEYEVILFDATE